MTQKQVAEKLYMHLTQYRRYETGESEIPLNIAINIAKLYNVSLDYIAGLSDERNSDDTMDSPEKHILKLFRKLNKMYQGMLLERAEMLSESNHNNNK